MAQQSHPSSAFREPAGAGGVPSASLGAMVVAPADFAFDWTAGDALPAGLVFTSDGHGLAPDANGIFQPYAANVPRRGYVWNNTLGQYVPAWWLEGVCANNAHGSNLFADATYWANAAPHFAVVAAPSCIAGQAAWQHTCDGTVGLARSQVIGVFVNSQSDCASAIVENVNAVNTAIGIRDMTTSSWVALATFTWATRAIAMTAGVGTCGVIPLGNGRYCIYVVGTGAASGTGAAGNSRAHFLYVTGGPANTNTAIVHHAQFEVNASFPSSPIVTVATAVQRAADLASVPWPYPPLVATMYADAINVGAANQPTGIFTPTSVCWIGGLTSGRNWHNRLNAGSAGRRVQCVHRDQTSGVQVVSDIIGSASTVSLGTRVEASSQLNADGSIQGFEAIDGGPVEFGSVSAPFALAAAWGAPILYLGGVANNVGGWALSRLRIAFGLQSMDQMRGLVPLTIPSGMERYTVAPAAGETPAGSFVTDGAGGYVATPGNLLGTGRVVIVRGSAALY